MFGIAPSCFVHDVLPAMTQTLFEGGPESRVWLLIQPNPCGLGTHSRHVSSMLSYMIAYPTATLLFYCTHLYFIYSYHSHYSSLCLLFTHQIQLPTEPQTLHVRIIKPCSNVTSTKPRLHWRIRNCRRSSRPEDRGGTQWPSKQVRCHIPPVRRRGGRN